MKIKRVLIILAMVAVVCSAVFLNYSFQSNNNETPVNATEPGDEQYPEDKVLGEAMFVGNEGSNDVETAAGIKQDYFTEARINRQTTRDESTELLKSIAADKDNSDEIRKKAAADLASIASAIEKEGKVESLIAAKGFEQCLAIIGDTSINVIVRSSGLSQPEVAQITEIAINETGFTGSAIKIVEIK